MAYDIIVFDPDLVPTDDAGFRGWADTLFTREKSGEQSPKIQALHDEALTVFPEDDDTSLFLDFDHLEFTFADDVAQAGSTWVQTYAGQNGLGVYDVDTTGAMTLPDPSAPPPGPLS